MEARNVNAPRPEEKISADVTAATAPLVRAQQRDATAQMPRTPEDLQRKIKETTASGQAKDVTQPSATLSGGGAMGLQDYTSPGKAARERTFAEQTKSDEKPRDEVGGAYPSLSSPTHVEEPEDAEGSAPVPSDVSEVQSYALPTGAAPYTGNAGSSRWLHALKSRFRRLLEAGRPHVERVYTGGASRMRGATRKVRDILEHESTQSLAEEAVDAAVGLARQYKGSLQCLIAQAREAPLSFQLHEALLIFLHVIVPLTFLMLPEAWTVLKYAFLSYLVGHVALHFTSAPLVECAAWSHLVFIPMLLELIITPGTESFVMGHPGWGYVINVYPRDMLLYLLWMRTTIAVTFAKVCSDVLVIELHVESRHRASVPSVSAYDSSAAAVPGKAAPTLVQLESVPASAKVKVTLETPPAGEAAAAHSVKQELTNASSAIKREGEEVKRMEPLPTPS